VNCWTDEVLNEAPERFLAPRCVLALLGEVIVRIGIFRANCTQESVQFVAAYTSALLSQLKNT
jgi:hypothetical protein